MLERTTRRTLPLLSRTSEFVPAAQACCGVCRGCVTTNVLSVLAAGAAASALYVVRFARRLSRS